MQTELITPEEMQRVEALSPSLGVSLEALMENAGRAVAAEIISRYPMRPITILCGPGNNGGDGFVVARLLDDLGWPVSIHFLGDYGKLKGQALANARKWKKEIRQIDAPFEGSLIVDALFGIGLSKDFPEGLATSINTAGVPVIAVDLPSGIDGLTGAVRGAAVKADVTVTFFRKKPAHVVEPGLSHCGEIVLSEIGIPQKAIEQFKPSVVINTASELPKLQHTHHKYSRGGVVVWSGNALSTGASRLAAVAAQRAGAGIVCLAGPRDGLMVQAHHVTSIILREAATSNDLSELLSDNKFSACCMGPGAGVDDLLRRATLAAITSGKRVVLDADAFSVFADQRDLLLRVITQTPELRVVMTPHEGEFARLFPDLTKRHASKLDRAKAAAALTNTVMVLKGEGTVIAHPDGRTTIQTGAPAKLATAGSGDVLAGLITGLLAQGMDPYAAARAGVWMHTEAALKAPQVRLVAEDLLSQLAI